jgi:toxin FitB
MYLLDTNVISELRKVVAGRADARVVTWNKSVSANDQFISTVSVFELETGILLMERRDPRQGAVLRGWLEQAVLPGFAGRVLPFDLAAARRCAGLHIPNPMPERDSYIAATALIHGMILVTRNTKDFAGTGVKLLNPWE